MKRLNILICTLLARGHVYPVLPLCHELSQRGHRITFATSNQFAGDIKLSGAEPLIFDSSPPGNEYEKWWNGLQSLAFDDPGWWSPPHEWICNLHADTAALDAKVRQTFGSQLLDLVLYDQYFYPGQVVSRRLACPRIRISAHFANYKGFLIRRNGICINPGPMLEFAKRVNLFLSEEGLHTNDSFWLPEDFNIQLFPDAFQYHRTSFDERFCFAGRSSKRYFSRNWNYRIRDDPIVLISGFSGIAGVRYQPVSYLSSLVAALADSECHCVLLSEQQDPSLRLPDNFEVCQGVSPLEVLPHAALLVCPGGMGSTLEATYSGVPALMIPTHPHADEVAYRAAELGLGRRVLREETAPESIRGIVAGMLWDTHVRERVKDMRGAFERSVGVPQVVERIEHFVAEL
jgi:MGT family glycosyltransferase